MFAYDYSKVVNLKERKTDGNTLGVTCFVPVDLNRLKSIRTQISSIKYSNRSLVIHISCIKLEKKYYTKFNLIVPLFYIYMFIFLELLDIFLFLICFPVWVLHNYLQF